MTPAITLLTKKRIAHSVLKYEHDANASSYGLEAVEKLNLNADTVFKTLVVSTDTNKLAVAVVPVNTKLSEKKMAKALGVKKVEMAQANAVMVATSRHLSVIKTINAMTNKTWSSPASKCSIPNSR